MSAAGACELDDHIA